MDNGQLPFEARGKTVSMLPLGHETPLHSDEERQLGQERWLTEKKQTHHDSAETRQDKQEKL
jgi:hypothetical protein